MKPSSYLMPLTLLSAFLALSACKQPATATPVPAINQGEICEVKGWQYDYAVEAACKPGQKILFVPASFGNEQLPVLFAAVNCDMRYAIALTNGAVACIYEPTTVARKGKAPTK
jgi:hypothetical protein